MYPYPSYHSIKIAYQKVYVFVGISSKKQDTNGTKLVHSRGVILPKNCSIFGQTELQIRIFFSQFLAAAFLARNVSQNHFPFSREMREMCMSNCDILHLRIFCKYSGKFTNHFVKTTISFVYFSSK